MLEPHHDVVLVCLFVTKSARPDTQPGVSHLVDRRCDAYQGGVFYEQKGDDGFFEKGGVYARGFLEDDYGAAGAFGPLRRNDEGDSCR